MSTTPEVLKPLKTWSHLAGSRRRPSEYEVVSTRLHYHRDNPECPWELDPGIFMNEWYRRYREGSPLQHPDWDAFRDPDEIVYRSYNVLQDGQETYLDNLLEEYAAIGHDQSLRDDWLDVLATYYTPARYPAHALQMASAYGGQMAPASTITNCFYFQTADQLRLVQRLAYRTAELARNRPGHGFGQNERAMWEDDPRWQGFRELLEKVLVAWDWGECFTALNLVAKPTFDEAVLREFALVARRNGDELLALVNDALLRDADRSRRWSAALVRMALEVPGNRDVFAEWVAKWQPLADAAAEAYLAKVPDLDARAPERVREAVRSFRVAAGLPG